MSRRPRFEVVRTDAGWHARFRASNGQVVWTTEVYTRRRTADEAVRNLIATILTTYEGDCDELEVLGVDERYVPPPVALDPPFYVANPLHYERVGRKVITTHEDFWHDHAYHSRQCFDVGCREGTPPVGTEVRSRMGTARYSA